jgi:ATPase subunit of ABC transporter with duplicated ATPase domains
MIQVTHLSISNTKEDRKLIKDLSFVVNDGEKIALIGEEGNGKTSILKVLRGENLPGFEVSGEVHLDQPIGYLEQNIAERWRGVNVVDYFLLSEPNGEINDYNILAKIPQCLAKVGFPMASYDEDKSVEEFSGGEIVRLALAKLLAGNYRTLLLDEPSNDLDFSSLALLREFILSAKQALLFVSHDENLLASCATGLIHLESWKSKSEPRSTFTRLSYEEYKQQRADLFAKQTQIVMKKRDQLQAKKERWSRIYQAVKDDQDQCVRDPTTGRLLKKKMAVMLSQRKRLEKEEAAIPEKPEEDPLLSLSFPASVSLPNWKRIISYHAPLFREDRLLVKQIDLELLGPGKCAIIGDNGVGKSTFLEELYRQNKERKDIRLGYMPQNYLEGFPKEGSVLSFLCPNGDKTATTHVRLFLGSLRFTSEEMLYPLSSLSGGQKAKLFFVKLVLDEDNVLLLDEPTRNLSPFSTAMLDSLLSSFQGLALVVSHDEAFLKRNRFERYEMTSDALTLLKKED